MRNENQIYPIDVNLTELKSSARNVVFENEESFVEFLKFQNPTIIAAINKQLQAYRVHVLGSGETVSVKKLPSSQVALESSIVFK